ncbi:MULTISPECIES: MarR family winged helix-turn-helix transcriptional regulator [Methylobacterium]|uniref:HTH-type transcriptional repressor NicR n=1 Tax=Methylobacterium isbiliense TaxID=315478 RepID=A0ABQ4SGX2_9HYPH|nr:MULTISPECIES: MarR family transcriptional regulator [Methylobacterium]MBY0297577.1 MarR family transcriptional regulator [Methylobacterium sp.]MDN3623789.1 MarR family transcriptional regulator [Methylobacterium isbiliense]GJE01148.1 HTH-type transcriptional repressor NicR [Methylobacterium isbiliense]
MSAPRRRLAAPRIDPEAVRVYRLEDQIGYLIRRAHQRASAIFEAVMRDFAVTPVQFAVLAKLHDLGPTSQNQLGRHVGVDPATMYGVARRLAARGLAHPAPDPDDARLVLLALTEEGRAVVEGMKSRGAEVTARTLDPLTPAEAAELNRLIAKLG